MNRIDWGNLGEIRKVGLQDVFNVGGVYSEVRSASERTHLDSAVVMVKECGNPVEEAVVIS